MTKYPDDVKNYPISLNEVIRARSIVSPFVKPTKLIRYEGLSRLLSADIFVKHENHNPTGTFKIRGGINLMHHLKQFNISRGDHILYGKSRAVGCDICEMDWA